MALGKGSTAADCAARCEKVSLCNGFHYYGQKDRAAGACYMKTGVTKITKMNDKRDRFASICGERISCAHTHERARALKVRRHGRKPDHTLCRFLPGPRR